MARKRKNEKNEGDNRPLDFKNDDDQAITELTGSDNVTRFFEPSLPIQGNGKGEKRLVMDIGARLRQLSGLKPGGVTSRTPEIVAEIIERLQSGESLLSVTTDPNMPGHSTIYDWMRDDLELAAAINAARATGAHVLFDAMQDVALGGVLSTGDRKRDELVLKVLDQTTTKRNRAVFGNQVEIQQTVNLPTTRPKFVLPTIPEAEFIEVKSESEVGPASDEEDK